MYKNRITQSVVVGLATLVAALSWSGVKEVLFNDGFWLWPTLGLLILSVFLSLNWLLTKSREILLVTLGFVLISFLFVFSFKIEYLGIIFLAFLLFALGSWRIVNERESRVKIEVVKILKKGLPFVMTGLSLVIASAYFFSPLSLIGQEKIEIPRSMFDSAVAPIAEIARIGLDLGQAQDALYQSVNSEINKRSQSYKEFFPISLSVGIFFALKVVSVPFMWLVTGLSFLVFKMLVWTKAIHIQEKSVLKEVIEI